MMHPVGAVDQAVWRLMQPFIMSLSSLCCIVTVGYGRFCCHLSSSWCAYFTVLSPLLLLTMQP